MAPFASFVLLGSLLAGQGLASPRVVSLPMRHGKTHVNHTASLHPRATKPFAASIENLLAGHQYFAAIGVGTPPQNVELVLDTGSSDAWMFGPGSCRPSKTGPCIGGDYDSSASSSFTDLQSKLGPFSARYGDGSTVQGPYFSDDIIIGGQKVSALTMGLASSARGIVRSGILGIGYSTNEAVSRRTYPNLPKLLVEQGLIASNSYSLYLDDIAEATGSILFGGYDPAKFYGNMVMMPIQSDPLNGRKDAFYVSLSEFGLSVEGNTYAFSSPHDPYPIPVLLDSGTETIGLPIELFTPFIRTFNLKKLTGGIQGRFSVHQVPCDQASKVGPGSVLFFFGSAKEGPVVQVPFEELIIPFYDPVSGQQLTDQFGQPFCRFGIAPATPGNPIILGQPFLRSAYVLYDLDNNAVGVAQVKYDKQSSNIIEYTGQGQMQGVVTDTHEPPAVTLNYQASSYIIDLPYATPRTRLVTRTAYTVPYPNATPPNAVATTPAAATGTSSDNGASGSLSGGSDGGNGGNAGSSITILSASASLAIAASLLVSLLGTVYIL